MVRVLQVLHNLKRGGVQGDAVTPMYILDGEDVLFDYLLLSDVEGELETEVAKKCNILRIPLKKSHNKIVRFLLFWYYPIYVYFMTLKLLKTNGPYDAIHVRHMLFIAPCLLAARKKGIKVRIAHSHVNDPGNDKLYVKFYLKISAIIINKVATIKLGVTQNAAEYLFGKSINNHVAKSPVLDLTRFNPDNYKDIYDFKGIRIIQVGSFGIRKNQLFTLNVLNEMLKHNYPTRLELIGYEQPGTDFLSKIKDRISELNLSDNVVFMPSNSDVAFELSHNDIMILPSIQEGLPNALLEAQAMGLHCFVSSSISTDCDMGLCTFLSLEKGPEFWANSIIQYSNTNGLSKNKVNMSSYDSRCVCHQYLLLWTGHSWEDSLQAFSMCKE